MAGLVTPRLRPVRAADRDAVREVCVRTGAAGRDATGALPDDGLLADLYAEPYLALAPGLGFVAADATDGVVGYVLGTADTDEFVAAWRAVWLPLAAARHPDPVAAPTTLQQRLVHDLHHPEVLRTRWADTHPAHLHVNLLPSARGAGAGRALVERFCAAVAAIGAPGVHLGTAVENTRAQAFYAALGFVRLGTSATAVWYGKRW